MKKKYFYFIILLALFLVSSIIGVIGYIKNKDYIVGNYFRRTYGSIGIVGENNYLLYLNLFSFNQDTIFLDDKEKLSFDNENVIIKNIEYDVQNTEYDVTIYNVNIVLSIKTEGTHMVSSIEYKNEDERNEYDIGEIYFFRTDKENINLNYGMNVTLNENDEAVYTFNETNPSIFIIKDLYLVNQDKTLYNYQKDIVYTPGEFLEYTINVVNNLNYGDVLFLNPIFYIEIDGVNQTYVFYPKMLMSDSEDLTYIEIREYIYDIS